MLDLLGSDVIIQAPGSAGKRASAVAGFIANTKLAAGGLPLRSMPNWLRPLMGWLMPKVGPRGLEFARARVEMKAAETVLHLRAHFPARLKLMVPPHIWVLMAPYGITPQKDEVP
jgi:coenzyme F420 hydrogenase subunit beta